MSKFNVCFYILRVVITLASDVQTELPFGMIETLISTIKYIYKNPAPRGLGKKNKPTASQRVVGGD